VIAPPAVYCVYRRRNAQVVERLLAPTSAGGSTVALWALDETDPALAHLTMGSGSGFKFDLINRLFGERPPPARAHVVVADDDAVFVRGDLVTFVRTAAAADLDLAQPAHVLWSNISHRITWMRPLSTARLTTFVEIGPIFAVSADWRDRIVPFPQGLGMGWGLDLQWMDLREEGCRLGIVDSTPIRHLSPFAAAYAPDDEVARVNALLAERGAAGWKGLRRTLATWHRWRRQPPWAGQELARTRS
jgi:hypothetical protein